MSPAPRTWPISVPQRRRSGVAQTGRRIVAGTWGCALIVMIGSTWSAAAAYGHLGDNRALGLATGIAVDIALCVALVGDRRLYAHGLTSNWGRSLRKPTRTRYGLTITPTEQHLWLDEPTNTVRDHPGCGVDLARFPGR